VAAGDEEALTRFYGEYADAVFRFVYRRVEGCYEDAEEITLDTFLLAVSYAATYDGSCAPLTWLCGLARRRLADFHRQRGRRKRRPPAPVLSLSRDAGGATFGDGADLESVSDRLETERVLGRALAGLSEDERDILLLRYVEQFSVREIAGLVGRSEKAVESLLTRAKKKAARSVTGLL
jgi:RNA polymerase sigma-70 factor (ECF subfamily)